jgi:multiple sugar transport system substrate-binding protein
MTSRLLLHDFRAPLGGPERQLDSAVLWRCYTRPRGGLPVGSAASINTPRRRVPMESTVVPPFVIARGQAETAHPNATRTTRRQIVRGGVAASAALGAAGLAACTRTAQTGTGAAAPGTRPTPRRGVKLSFMSWGTAPAFEVRSRWAADFQSQNPGLQAEFLPVTDPYMDKLQGVISGGQAPDIFLLDPNQVSPVLMATKRMTTDLVPFTKRDKYDLSDYRPTALDLYRYKDGLYGMPRDYGNQDIYYNASLFDTAGVTHPTADWTDSKWVFGDLITAAQKLMQVGSGGAAPTWGIHFGHGFNIWASFVWANGGEVINKEETACLLTEAPAVEGLQYVQDLIYRYKVAVPPDVLAQGSPYDLFGAGRLGMFVTNPSDVANFRRAATSFTWDVGALPRSGSHRRATGGGGTCWGQWADTKNPEEAWLLMQFITSPAAQISETDAGTTTPSRKSVAYSDHFIDPNRPPQHAKTFADAQEYVHPFPKHVKWLEITQAMTEELTHLWDGSQVASQVAASIKRRVDDLLKQTG